LGWDSPPGEMVSGEVPFDGMLPGDIKTKVSPLNDTTVISERRFYHEYIKKLLSQKTVFTNILSFVDLISVVPKSRNL
jgi:hypothetical protein